MELGLELVVEVEQPLDVAVWALEGAGGVEGVVWHAPRLEQLLPLQTLQDERFERSIHATRKQQQKLKQ